MRHWLRSYLLLLRWHTIRLRYLLPLMLVIQTLLAVGIVVGFSFLLPTIDDATALYLATGAPTLGLITVGMVLAPQMVAQAKTEGTFDYHRTLPVPRSALLAADVTTWFATSLPGLALALFTATLRFDLDLDVSPLVVPAILLVALTATAIGYAISYAVPPAVANLAAQVIVFVALMFSPINFPADRLPGWLQAVHQVLPFQHMAEAIRGTLVAGAAGLDAVPFAVLAVWCALGLTVTLRVMTRRS
ncbi:ABC transporter permease [Micromonospora endolithica]|uniref:ABC transporter permease n=1 Tax=Micromonospora endolithica TaxID=230091 RepID=A0A3A9ZBD1_9ACTN|nr:ABC transporter permease [Micromonospora endolithica]RKN45429.1 ABC transporter permease [Micromonospora endolithica]TWJ22849.1 ABC-2 type transport system permease protein [Micromonospora endolithica]